MDAKAIVKEMIANGQSKEEIIMNLNDLGVPSPEKYYEEAIAEEGKGVLQSGGTEGIGGMQGKRQEGSGKPIFGGADAAAEKEAKEILDSQTKPLFGSAKPAKTPTTTDEAMEDIPQLEITSIGSEGEKIKDIGEMLGKKEAQNELMRQMPRTSLQNTDELEAKLDEMISLLKAVYDIDKKILEANRDVLLRLKMK